MTAIFPTYNRFDLKVKKAEGSYIETVEGKELLDLGSGIGVNNLGHRHPVVQQAIEEQLQKYWHVSNLYHNPIQEDVASLLTKNSIGDYAFFCNSGAEANEAAIKLARKVTGKEKIITFNQSFHGRTFATMAATGQDKVRIGFGAMLQKFGYAHLNDIDSIKNEIDDNTAAVMFEVVQGEGGIIPAEQSFIDELVDLCEQKDVLLIVDEIQTGIGRTGKKFGYEHYGISPDIITLAKGLGNGVPVGAMVAKEKYRDAFGPGSHGSTFGGNPIAMAAAKAVLTTVFDEKFLQEVNEKADYLMTQLNEKIRPIDGVKAVRGKGLMVGIEYKESVAPFIQALIKEGILALNAGDNVLRLLPPLTVTKEEIDRFVTTFENILNER